MDHSQPPEKNEKGTPNAVLRHMGMSLSVFGAILFSAGLVGCWRNSGGTPDARCILVLASGIVMFLSGLYIWRIAKGLD